MRDQPDLPELSAAALRALREDQPSERELAAAYRRFARPPQRRSTGLLVSRWLVASLVMGLGIAFGAQAVVQRLGPPSASGRPPPAAMPSAARKVTPVSAPEATPQGTPEPETELPPASAEPPAPRPSSSANSNTSAVVSTRPPADSAVWAKAAQGLRNNDIAQTQSALATLEHSGSVSDREAARLIRAQLMLHQGDESGAQALLRDLASNAQSAQVRAKARNLLAQASAKSNFALNSAGAAPK